MKKGLSLLSYILTAALMYSCSSTEDIKEDISIPYYDKSLMGTWISSTNNDTIYATFGSASYSKSMPYFEEISWIPSKNTSDNVKRKWYYIWVAERTMKRHQSASDISDYGETIIYKISAKGDSLFLDNRTYIK